MPSSTLEQKADPNRADPAFWPFFDWMNEWNVTNSPVDAGLMDVSEYLWPDFYARGVPEQDDSYEPNNSREEAAPLEFGRTELVACSEVPSWWPDRPEEYTRDRDEDWFSFNVDRPGRLAIEIVFDSSVNDISARA